MVCGSSILCTLDFLPIIEMVLRKLGTTVVYCCVVVVHIIYAMLLNFFLLSQLIHLKLCNDALFSEYYKTVSIF